MKLLIRNGNEIYESQIHCQTDRCSGCLFRFRCFTDRELNITVSDLDDMARDNLSDVTVSNLMVRQGRGVFYYNKLFDVLKNESYTSNFGK